MRVVTILNFKGGVCKTTTADNMAHILATMFKKKVLLVDLDKQGNSSKFYGKFSYEHKSISDIMLGKCTVKEAIRHTEYEGLDVIPANMMLLAANQHVATQMSMQSLTILKKALEPVQAEYDVCIIDCPPDINASVINALNVSNEVIVPVVIDQFSFDGFDQLEVQFNDARQINPGLTFRGCLITRYDKKEEKYIEGQDLSRYKLFNTRIHRTDKVSGSTFVNTPIFEYSRRCGATRDYINFVKEYFSFK